MNCHLCITLEPFNPRSQYVGHVNTVRYGNKTSGVPPNALTVNFHPLDIFLHAFLPLQQPVMLAHIYMGTHLTEWPRITMHMFPQLLTNYMMTMHLGHLINSHIILNIVYGYVHVYVYVYEHTS